jgi:hypothetical protein
MAKITIYDPKGISTLYKDANRIEVREGILTFYVHEDPALKTATKYSTNFPFLVEEPTGHSGI